MSSIPEHLQATQSKHPWQAVLRTLFAAVVGLAAMAAPVYEAITQGSAAAATGWAAVALAICGAVTRVLALPGVDAWLAEYLPWLSTGHHLEAGSARGDYESEVQGDE